MRRLITIAVSIIVFMIMMAGPVFASEYVVQEGDCLWRIVSKNLGTDDPRTIIDSINSIVDANVDADPIKYSHLLTDWENDGIRGDLIHPGDIFDLPSTEPIETAFVSPIAPEEAAPVTETTSEENVPQDSILNWNFDPWSSWSENIWMQKSESEKLQEVVVKPKEQLEEAPEEIVVSFIEEETQDLTNIQRYLVVYEDFGPTTEILDEDVHYIPEFSEKGGEYNSWLIVLGIFVLIALLRFSSTIKINWDGLRSFKLRKIDWIKLQFSKLMGIDWEKLFSPVVELPKNMFYKLYNYLLKSDDNNKGHYSSTDSELNLSTNAGIVLGKGFIKIGDLLSFEEFLKIIKSFHEKGYYKKMVENLTKDDIKKIFEESIKDGLKEEKIIFNEKIMEDILNAIENKHKV